MVTVYNNKLALFNHNQHKNSNWIMPFLVQNDTMIKGLTTQIKDYLKEKGLFSLKKNAVHIPQIHKALLL